MALDELMSQAGLGKLVPEGHGQGCRDMQGLCSARQGDTVRAAHIEDAGRYSFLV